MEPQITHQDKLNALRIKIRQLYTQQEDINPDELSKKYEIEYKLTQETINQEINDLTQKQPTDDMLTSDQTIKTKETLAFLHKNSKSIRKNHNPSCFPNPIRNIRLFLSNGILSIFI